MNTMLEQKYKTEYKLLRELFGFEFVNERIKRLNTIHEYTESLWSIYIRKIPNKTVKYLLIAESPPWSQDGQPQYFLDPNSSSRSLMNAFSRAFFPNNRNKNLKLIINNFAENGFLLVDSIPFSMCYSGFRSLEKYNELIELTVKSYMIKKMVRCGLKYSENMKIVFGYKVNALCVIKSLDGVLAIRNNRYYINENMICTNASNYPDVKYIREILNLAAV